MWIIKHVLWCKTNFCCCHISKESIATTFLTKELMDYAGFYFEYTIFLSFSLEKAIQNKDYWCVEVSGLHYNSFILFLLLLTAAIYHHLIVVCKHWGSYRDIKDYNAASMLPRDLDKF